MNNINPREEIVFLLRGLFACRTISSLSNLDQIDIFLKKKFKINDFKKINNKKLLSSLLNYLICLNLLKKKKDIYSPTYLGNKIFKRYGSFLLIDSYKDYMNNLENLLFNKNLKSFECNRLENVIGSGQTNGRKFFPEAINLISKNNYEVIIDIACGDGNFLEKINAVFPQSSLYALDISKIAVDKTFNNLKIKNIKVQKIICDGKSVNIWQKNIKKIDKNKKTLLSMWYFLHEISKNNKNNIIKFLKNIKKFLPNSHLLIGEIYKIKNEVLSTNRHSSIMPEFNFFHEISGQGLLSENDYKSIFKEVGCKIIQQKNFDIIYHGKKKYSTSSVTLIEL